MESHDTALILIGFQNDYFSPQGVLFGYLAGRAQVLANTIDLVERLRSSPVLIVDTPIIFTPGYSELVDPTGILKLVLTCVNHRNMVSGARSARLLWSTRTVRHSGCSSE